MNLRDMLNAVLAESAHIKKANFAGSNDVDDAQMIAIANRVATEIRDYYNWGELRKTHTVSIVGGQERYPMPNDFRTFVPDSAWETDSSRPVDIPVPDGRWYRYKFSDDSDAGTVRARFYGNEIEIHKPSSGEAFSFEYVSGWVVQETGGAIKELFTTDTDTFLLDDDLLILGVQAKWALTKMLPQAQQWQAGFRFALNEAIGRSNAGQTVGGAPIPGRYHPRSPYYPLYRRS